MSEEKNTLIKFGNQWVPVHQVWKKMESMNIAAEVINDFNKKHPKLATEVTKAIVPEVKRRLKQITFSIDHSNEQVPKDTLVDEVLVLLQNHSLEETIDIIAREKEIEMDIQGLVQLIGHKQYEKVLKEEADLLSLNRISAEQMAELWNEQHRPPPGGGFWSAKKISQLLDS